MVCGVLEAAHLLFFGKFAVFQHFVAHLSESLSD